MDNKAKKIEMKDLVDYCNNYGFIFQGSEIYGGLANTWDYGPLGSRLKNTIKDAWRYQASRNTAKGCIVPQNETTIIITGSVRRNVL